MENRRVPAVVQVAFPGSAPLRCSLTTWGRNLSGNSFTLGGCAGTGGKAWWAMALKDEWDNLDSETRTWLLENPGCVIVPRTLTSRIRQHAAGPIDCDAHGQMLLSREDLDFIREQGGSTGSGRVAGNLRFFDANQPGTSGNRASFLPGSAG